MENMGDWKQKNLLNHELTRGMELARELQIQLNELSSSHETRKWLVEEILATFDKTLATANCIYSSMSEPSSQLKSTAIRITESPPLILSPRSEGFDRDFKDQTQKEASKNSKEHLPIWVKQIRVNPGIGLEASLDDGYSWRKYGQKDILGAKYPRGYYRCNRIKLQGCSATKQVQRSDEDPSIFLITYRGKHTCTEASNTNNHRPSSNQELASSVIFHQRQNAMQQQKQKQQSTEEVLVDLPEGLRIQIENLDTQYPSSSFYFPSASDLQLEKTVFSPSLNENSSVQNFSPSFMSPTTSGANPFSVRPDSFGENYSFPSSELEIHGVSSAAISAANSPTRGLDHPFGQVELEPNFMFNNLGFFS